MNLDTIIVAALALIGTLFSSYVTGNKNTAMILYRLEALEKKQDRHNSVIERTYSIEKHMEVIDEQIKVANHRIEDLENK